MNTRDRITLHWLLRIAVAMEFIGHGAFGILGKEAWVPYITFWGIPESLARQLVPVVGSSDIALGLSVLVRPTRSALCFMAIWGLFTACLRPLTGESILELIERSYNYGVPAIFLALSGWPTAGRGWFEPLRPSQPVAPNLLPRVAWALRIIIAMMMIGHGGYGVWSGKKALVDLYSRSGLAATAGWEPIRIAWGIGVFEVLLGLGALVTRQGSWLWIIAGWKILTEGLHFPAGAHGALWEFIERGSAYLAPVALLVVTSTTADATQTPNRGDDTPGGDGRPTAPPTRG